MAKIYKFSDFLHRSKIPIDIIDSENYKRVTIKTKHGGVSLRDTEIGKKIGTKKQFVLKSGQFILSKIDARYGAFGIAPEEVDNCIITGNFWAYDVDFNLIDINWFNQYTNSRDFYDLCERASSGITHRKYLSESAFLNNEILLPDLDEQRNSMFKIENLKSLDYNISTELTHQLSLISQLRQAFLREAMRGVLVSNETSDGKTGADLLAEIKAEKEQLIKDKKIKKGKPLPPISEEEIPFEIPEELPFIRLGEICKVEKGKIGIQKAERSGSIPLVVTSEERQTHNEIHFDGPSVIIPLVSSTGHGHASMKRIHFQEGSFAVGNILGCIQTFLPEFFNMKFLFHFLDTYKQTFFVEKMKGAANVSLKLSSIEETPIPLVRKEIQDKYEELILHLENLEASVKESQNYNAQLLQQVLREALEGKEEKTEALALVAEEKPYYQAPKIYTISSMTILAGHVINQLSTSNSKDLGRVKLLKMMHLVQYHCQLETPLHFHKKTAGPYTSDLENQIERKLKHHRFFEIEKEKLTDFEKVTYTFLAASSSLETIFPREFGHKANDINKLLSKFRSKNTAFCERVSTMYAVWNNRLLKKETITDELLKADFLQWDEGKKKFEKDLDGTLDWMRRNGVVPVGFGELI